MGSLYVPGLEDSNWASTSPSAAGTAVWVTLSGTPTQRPLSSPVWRTRPWIGLLSGTISQPSTAGRGVASWISSLRASPASLGPRPAGGSASTTPGGCGLSSPGQSPPSDPAGCSWRTAPGWLTRREAGSWATATPTLDFRPGSTLYSGTWPTSGSMRNGCVWERTTWEPRTSANGCSYWPTPVAHEDNRSPEAHLAMKARMGGNRTAVTSLNVAVKMWPTPTAAEGQRGSDPTRPRPNGDSLGGVVLMWPTPRANDGEKRGQVANTKRNGLVAASQMWPTPTARDTHGAHYGHTKGGRDLATDAAMWPTPAAHDAKATGPSQMERHSPTLVEAAGSFHPDATTPKGGDKPSPTGYLNPSFVEMLMGWPPGWTDCEPWGTDASPRLRRWRSLSSRTVSDALATFGVPTLGGWPQGDDDE